MPLRLGQLQTSEPDSRAERSCHRESAPFSISVCLQHQPTSSEVGTPKGCVAANRPAAPCTADHCV
jgi:hypothetical protein